MSSAPPDSQTVSAGAVVRTLGLVAAICGVIIVATYQGTLSAVKANRKIALDRAVFKVIPGAKSVVSYYMGPSGPVRTEGDEAPAGTVKFYAAYGGAGELRGIAAEGAAQGYADLVRIIYAYNPDKQQITGIGVVSMRETPGIGDRILTDKEFLANFEHLDVRLDKDLRSLAHAVRTVKHGTKQNPWEIDAISGATVTSKAVGRGINESTEALLSKLVPSLGQLRRK